MSVVIGPDDGYDTLRHRASALEHELRREYGWSEHLFKSRIMWSIERSPEGVPLRMYASETPTRETWPEEMRRKVDELAETKEKIALWERARKKPRRVSTRAEAATPAPREERGA